VWKINALDQTYHRHEDNMLTPCSAFFYLLHVINCTLSPIITLFFYFLYLLCLAPHSEWNINTQINHTQTLTAPRNRREGMATAPRRLSPHTKPSSTPSRVVMIPSAQPTPHGHDGHEGGHPRRTGMVTY